MAQRNPSRSVAAPASVTRRLARFRYELRKFLRFSERAARACGVTAQQHQLLLGVAGFTGRGWATVSELAECLQARHNAVVGLVQRAERRGLVRKSHAGRDRRFVRVHVTPRGRRLLRKLSGLHWKEIEELRRTNPGVSRLAAGRNERPWNALDDEWRLAQRQRQRASRRGR
jgi:DNA-binding MarR family transcriptional regulator